MHLLFLSSRAASVVGAASTAAAPDKPATKSPARGELGYSVPCFVPRRYPLSPLPLPPHLRARWGFRR